ncbi:Alpha/Beta hydrolase protein [Zopfochytrium polystomum]|nr:Alpha/Beta hydrolase protein [Zopfochytrium polystomum]
MSLLLLPWRRPPCAAVAAAAAAAAASASTASSLQPPPPPYHQTPPPSASFPSCLSPSATTTTTSTSTSTTIISSSPPPSSSSSASSHSSSFFSGSPKSAAASPLASALFPSFPSPMASGTAAALYRRWIPGGFRSCQPLRRHPEQWDDRCRQAEAALLRRYVKTPYTQMQVPIDHAGNTMNTIVLNGAPNPDPNDPASLLHPDRKCVVVTHGYGSGLGFWFSNLDALAAELVDPETKRPYQIVCVDWLGMGRSSRPSFLPPRQHSPLRSRFHAQHHRDRWGGGRSHWAAARFPAAHATGATDTTALPPPPPPPPQQQQQQQQTTTPTTEPPADVAAHEAYFIDALDAWRRAVGLTDRPFSLVGHSLGGYLSAAYALKFSTAAAAHRTAPQPSPARIDKLILVSPFGLPPVPASLSRSHPIDTSQRRSGGARVSLALRLLLASWSNNLTPQGLLRSVGTAFGKRLTQRMVAARFPRLGAEEHALIAQYLYGISTGPAAGEFALNALMRVVVGRRDDGDDVETDDDDGPSTPGRRRHRPPPRATDGGLYARSAMEPRLQRGLSTAVLPVTLLFGDRDWMLTSDVLALPMVRTRRAEVGIVTRAGHHLYLDNPDEFHAKLRDALMRGG